MGKLDFLTGGCLGDRGGCGCGGWVGGGCGCGGCGCGLIDFSTLEGKRSAYDNVCGLSGRRGKGVSGAFGEGVIVALIVCVVVVAFVSAACGAFADAIVARAFAVCRLSRLCGLRSLRRGVGFIGIRQRHVQHALLTGVDGALVALKREGSLARSRYVHARKRKAQLIKGRFVGYVKRGNLILRELRHVNDDRLVACGGIGKVGHRELDGLSSRRCGRHGQRHCEGRVLGRAGLDDFRNGHLGSLRGLAVLHEVGGGSFALHRRNDGIGVDGRRVARSGARCGACGGGGGAGCFGVGCFGVGGLGVGGGRERAHLPAKRCLNQRVNRHIAQQRGLELGHERIGSQR